MSTLNTATIRETGQSDDAKVTVTCTPPPAQGCTLHAGLLEDALEVRPRSQDRSHVGPDRRGHGVLPERADLVPGDQHAATGGNAYYILARQYIAAKLNILSGAGSTAEVNAAIAWAETFFSTYTPSST